MKNWKKWKGVVMAYLKGIIVESACRNCKNVKKNVRISGLWAKI
jgi:hypothetical protein